MLAAATQDGLSADLTPMLYIGNVGAVQLANPNAQIITYDRDESGQQLEEHDSTAYTAFAPPGARLGLLTSGKSTAVLGAASWGGSQDTSMLPTWNSLQPRTDGYHISGLTIQGVRAYDPTSSQWTTPDAYAGDVHDPMSQEPFMWNGNNPINFSDPSGFAAINESMLADLIGSGEASSALDSGAGANTPPSPDDDPANGTYTLEQAGIAAARAYTSYADHHLNKDLEADATIACSGAGTGCQYGAYQTSGASNQTTVTFNARTDGRLYFGWWHTHPAYMGSNEQSLADHQLEMQGGCGGVPDSLAAYRCLRRLEPRSANRPGEA